VTAKPGRVGIGVCADLEGSSGLDLEGSSGLDLRVLRRELAEAVPNVHVEVVPDLCSRPEQTPEIASRAGARRLVLGLCARPASRHDFQAWARKAGLDPFALELVSLKGVRTGSVAAALLAAAAARARAFAGSEPEQLKLELLAFERKRSRRALFSLPPITYRAVAGIEQESCLGARCGLCVSACPFGAIEMIDGRPSVDRAGCMSCGVCVTTCPTEAIRFPGASLPQYEAEIAALLSVERAALFFGCRHGPGDGAAPAAVGWLPVEVPCLGMVTSGWILQALAGGASVVGLLSCGERCRSGCAAAVRDRVEYVRALLRRLGASSPNERVMVVPGDVSRPAPRPAALAGQPSPHRRRSLTLSDPAATAEAVLKLAERLGAARDLTLVSGASPLGLVALRKETCTACGACAAACPTGALDAEEGGEGTLISYDAGLCVPCGRCARACPEADTLSVRAATDLAALTSRRVVLKREPAARCRRCGRPVAPAAMLDRVRALLQDEEGADRLLEVLTELCPDCRELEAM